MKIQSLIVLLTCAPLVWAEDDSKTPPRTSSRPAVSSSENAAQAPRPSQTGPRRPVATPGNPSVRPVNPNGNGIPAHRVLPTVNRNRPVLPSTSPIAAKTPSRAAAGKPGASPNTTTAGRGNHVRIPSRTGNELSFSQARDQCSRHHHDRDWWRRHHTIIVFYGGGYWFWNAGWWFPAWGYSPYYNNYAYDGPIYGYGEMSPGDVTAQVQEALAQQGYYYGPIDGVLGPETRDAILRFQADNGLATTAAIDEPTLDSLGLT